MEARKPYVKVKKWGGEPRIADNVTVSIATGSYPSINAQHHKNTDVSSGAQKVTAEELFSALGKQQTAAFKGAGDVNTEVEVFCDDGQPPATFKGMAGGDSYSFSASAVAISGTALPEWTMIDTLNYSIYTEADTPAPDIHLSADPDKDNILDIIKAAEQSLIDNWSTVTDRIKKAIEDGVTFPYELEAKTAIHNRNMKYRGYFLQLLENSKQTFGWSSLTKLMENKNAKEQINITIREAAMAQLTGSVGNFLSVISAIAGQFQCVYVPEYSSPGKLINMAYLVASNPEDLTINCLTGCSMYASNPDGVLPIGYVFVKCPDSNDGHMSYQFKGVGMPKATRTMGGAVMEVNIPDWCNTVGLAVDFRSMTVREFEEGTTTDASLEQIEVDLSDTAEEDAQEKYAVGNVAKAWGLCAYAWSALVNCRATLNVPATLKYTIGKRYKVKLGESELFTGFLDSCSTTINSENCLTTLEFSHIMASGFELPGTDEMKENGLVY